MDLHMSFSLTLLQTPMLFIAISFFLPSLPSSSSSSSTFFLFFYLFNFLIFFPLISLLVFLYPSSSSSSSYFCAAQVNPINHILSIILVSFFYFIDQQIER